jgi:hypothetical protein
MKMTTARHTVLARLSDGNWEHGHDLAPGNGSVRAASVGHDPR